MREKEERIKEQRLLEATRKGLTGLEGKFGTILQYLGQPIISAHAGSYFESNELPDVYADLEDEPELPTADVERVIVESGYVFDALSSGLHLEIQYLAEKQKLAVYYCGNLVYCEIASDLECYVPSTEWESKVDMLYNEPR